MEKVVILNTKSADARVGELVKILESQNIPLADFGDKLRAPAIAFLEPRFFPSGDQLVALPQGTRVFGFPKDLGGLGELGLEYISLCDDSEFVADNNRLTARAMREILIQRFKTIENIRILIIGWGQLFKELESELSDAQIHLLTLNPAKIDKARGLYGERAHGAEVNLAEFQIIINTIPQPLIDKKFLNKISSNSPAIYDLASPPYGINWDSVVKAKFDYRIEPSLPGRFYPREAAQAILRAIMRQTQLTPHINTKEETMNKDKNIEKERADELVTVARTEGAKPAVVLGITGSSCTYTKLLPMLRELVKTYDVIPVMSDAADQENRFCDIKKFRKELMAITGQKYLKTIADTEILSHNANIVAGAVIPATGNTIARLANAIHDGAVTLAMKALLRNSRPVIIGISTNDALCGNAENIGKLLGRKNIYFVPFKQDDPTKKPFSIVCDFTKVKDTLDSAIKGKQLQPILS